MDYHSRTITYFIFTLQFTIIFRQFSATPSGGYTFKTFKTKNTLRKYSATTTKQPTTPTLQSHPTVPESPQVATTCCFYGMHRIRFTLSGCATFRTWNFGGGSSSSSLPKSSLSVSMTSSASSSSSSFPWSASVAAFWNIPGPCRGLSGVMLTSPEGPGASGSALAFLAYRWGAVDFELIRGVVWSGMLTRGVV